MFDLLALPLGLLIGAIGSLTGIGGGFLIMPILLLLYPEKSLAGLTLLSMVVVLCNSLAGTVPALLRRRITWRVALPYALATVPPSLIGLWLQAQVTPGPFRKVFGGFMAVAALFLVWRQTRRIGEGESAPDQARRFKLGLAASFAIGRTGTIAGPTPGGAMAIQRSRIVLRQHKHLEDIGVDAIGYRDINETILSAERHGRL